MNKTMKPVIDIHNLTQEQKDKLDKIKKERELKLMNYKKRQAKKDKMINETFEYMKENEIEVLNNENGYFNIRKPNRRDKKEVF